MSSETIPSRISVASLAVIRRSGPDGLPRYLTQYNAKWQAFSAIGGHKRDNESHRACMVREIAEELGVFPYLDDPDALAASTVVQPEDAPRCRVAMVPLGM